MTAVRHVIYLHGFSSSPLSSKAQRFARELSAAGVSVDCPNLNEPAFETLTVTRMLDRTAEALALAPAGPVALIGSSLGAFVAVHAAARRVPTEARRVPGAVPANVDRLILLAPALEFGGNRLRRLGEHGIEEWRLNGRLTVFHYADNAPRSIGFQLYEDAAQYDAFALTLTIPILIFQGRQDDTVDPQSVERWAAVRPSVDLRMVDDGHQLGESMDLIWEESQTFLGLR